MEDFFFQALQALAEGSVPSDVSESSDTQIPSASGPSGNHYQTPENSPRPVGSGAPSPMSEGSSQQGSPMSPPSLRRWLRRNFRETLIVDGVSSSASLLSTPNSTLQATPVQPMPESTVGPSTPGPKTPELPGRSVKRLFEDKKK